MEDFSVSLLQVRVEIESLSEGVDLSEPLTRARFEELNNDLFKKTLGPVKKAMEDADLKKVSTELSHNNLHHFVVCLLQYSKSALLARHGLL